MAAETPSRMRPSTSMPADQATPHNTEVGGERRHAGHEEKPPPVKVAEPAAGDEEDGVSRCIARHHELHLGGRGVQLVVDRGQRHVDDEEIGGGQEAAGQQHGERDPARAGRRGRGHGGSVLGGGALPKGRRGRNRRSSLCRATRLHPAGVGQRSSAPRNRRAPDRLRVGPRPRHRRARSLAPRRRRARRWRSWANRARASR